MKLSSVLLPNHIVVGLRARTIYDAIPEIVQRVDDIRFELPRPRIVDAIRKREDTVSTVLAAGVAVPHARIPELRDFYVMLGTATTPLEDVGKDGRSIDLVFLILCNDRKHSLMLQTLAGIGTVAHDGALLERIRAARTRNEVWRCIDAGGPAIRRGLYARDIMRPVPISFRGDDVLRDFLDACASTGAFYAPVCDDTGKVIGSITSLEIVDAGFPPYMTTLRSISFLNPFEPFQEIFGHEATTRLDEIMNPKPLVVDVNDPLIQVVFRMRQRQERLAFVEEGGTCVGVIDRDDICERVLRA